MQAATRPWACDFNVVKAEFCPKTTVSTDPTRQQVQTWPCRGFSVLSGFVAFELSAFLAGVGKPAAGVARSRLPTLAARLADGSSGLLQLGGDQFPFCGVVYQPDVVFAVDSIPDIFAITTAPFIIFALNIFAILGLRALYFLLADMADSFNLLKYDLAMVLIFIGTKMLIAFWVHLPMVVSLVVITVLIGSSVVASMIATRTS